MTLPDSAALANLARIGKLKVEPPDARERAGLLRSASVRLQDARQPILSLESRFDLAYNAARAAALSALRAHGYPLSNGDRINDHHLKLEDKRKARGNG